MERNLRLLMICFIPTWFMDIMMVWNLVWRARPKMNTCDSLTRDFRTAMILWNAQDELRITINCVL